MTALTLQQSTVRARQAGFLRDVVAIAGRALRAVPRETEAVLPPVFISAFFFVVNIGTLENLTEANIAGFGYAIALKTGNPAAVNSSFLLFFPFLFLTSSYVPRDQLSGWLDTVAGWNPVTYLLEGMRSLALSGWHWDDLGKAFLAVVVVFLVSFGLCFAALRARVNQR